MSVFEPAAEELPTARNVTGKRGPVMAVLSRTATALETGREITQGSSPLPRSGPYFCFLGRAFPAPKVSTTATTAQKGHRGLALCREVLAQPRCRQPGQCAGAGHLLRLAPSAGSSAHRHPALQQCHPAHPETGLVPSVLETVRPRKPRMGVSFQLGDPPGCDSAV